MLPRAIDTVRGDLLEFVGDAALQDEFLSWDEFDQNDQEFKIIYAVDSNVVDVFTDPSGRASKSDHRQIGYGEIFKGDSHAQKAAFVSALGKYIWYHLTEDRPLLLIPTVDEEVFFLLQKAGRSLTRPDDAKVRLASLAARLRSETGKAAQDAARELAVEIVNLKRVARLLQLRKDDRLRSVDELFDGRFNGFDRDAISVFAPMTSLRKMVSYAELRSKWEDLLGCVGRIRDQRFERDIDALARLEMWNEDLARLTPRRRLVYITGDSSILAAAKSRTVSNVFRDHFGEMTFQGLFVRHPRCFLDRPGALREMPDKEYRVSDPDSLRSLLSLLLGEFQKAGRRLGAWNWAKWRFELEGNVKDDVKTVGEKRPGFLSAFLTDWAKFADAVELTAFNSGHLIPFDEQDKELRVDALREYISGHMTDLQRELDESWDACVEAFSEFRFLIRILSEHHRSFRITPGLCLEGEGRDRFLKAAERWLAKPEEFDQNVFEDEKKASRDIDGTDYNFLVTTAYILASGQNWPSAAFLCAHARSIAEKETNKHGDGPVENGANGREACYLETIARRHLARTSDELASIEKLLVKAEDIHKKELAIHNQKGSAPLDVVPERFEIERCSLHHARIMLEWYKTKTYDAGELADELKALFWKYKELYHRVEGRKSREGATPVDCEGPVKLVRRRALVNLVSIAAFLSDDLELGQISGPYVEQLAALEKEAKENRIDFGVNATVVLRCGQAFFGSATERSQYRQRARATIDQVLASKMANDGAMVFDEARYKRFRDKLEEVR